MRQAVHYLSDVISIVFASVVGSYKGYLQVVQCLMHSQSLGVLGYLLEKFLYIDMLIAHWVRQFSKCTLLLEHIPIVIPITRPSVLIGLVFLFKDLQGFFKTYAFPRYQFGGNGSKLGTKRTDFGMCRLYQNTSVIANLTSEGIEQANAYFYNFADFSFGGVFPPNKSLLSL